ncbi:hypothetical protein Vsou_13280 [Vulcanisaeta souniana JCM 11219]|nr:hypothetical protein Vsou_13280 [Vulcanisaeta souniana JCM 11219]
MITRIPNLPPLKAVFGVARNELLPKYVSDLTARMVRASGYFIVRNDREHEECMPGPSMVNDKCPIASVIRCRLGSIVRNGNDLMVIAMGLAVHEAYINTIIANNPGWAIQYNTYYQTLIRHNEVEFTIGFSPDILLGYNGEWHLVEIKSSHPRPEHEAQLALYYYLLRDYYHIVRGWLVAYDAVVPYSTRDLEALAGQGLDYLYTVRRVLDSWRDDKPGFIVRGRCPCKYAPACPVWTGIVAYA